MVSDAKSVANRAKSIIHVHGEEKAARKLQEKFQANEDIPQVNFPVRQDSFEL